MRYRQFCARDFFKTNQREKIEEQTLYGIASQRTVQSTDSMNSPVLTFGFSILKKKHNRGGSQIDLRFLR